MTTLAAPANLVDVLRVQAQVRPDATAAIYLGDGEEIKGQVTFGELDAQARAIGARLQGLGAPGECALLVYPPGLEFLSAFFGCFYANVIPVPLPLPHSKGTVAQFPAITQDLDARLLLTTATTMSRLRRMALSGVDALVRLHSEDTQPDLARAYRPHTPADSATAYLQYTSGSTASRKGVIVSHANVVAHLGGMAERFRHHPQSVSVNWLPHTHDLGLVSGILQPLFHGHLNVLMSPNAFVQQPIRWLNALTRFRGTYTSSPNFGYDHCVRKTTPEQRAGLDLRPWDVALNGAEPVHQQTLEQFAGMFEPCGLRRDVMFPAYGMAESTLMISGPLPMTERLAVRLDAAALEQNRIQETEATQGARMLVGCGAPMPHTTVRIVNPLTCRECDTDEVGEIWARGPGITGGYWRRPDESAETFHGRIADSTDDQPYLRTGDLGFLRQGELFITGRWKDLVIIRGANHYPQDIEWTIEQSHEAFRPGCGGAFSLETDDGESLIVVYELERDHLKRIEPEDLLRLARRAVAEEHDLHIHTLVLLKTGTVPRTTSGKIQRRRCRADFLHGELSEVWRSADVVAVPVPVEESAVAAPSGPGDSRAATAAQMVEWLREYASERLNSHLMDERRSLTPHVVLDFGNRGVLGLQVARESGGCGFGHTGYVQVVEQIGAIDQTLAMMTIVQNSLGIWPIAHHADPSLRDRLIPRLASGRELAAFAMTEPAAGSNPQAILTTATADSAHAWRLRGTKCWSGTAGWASVVNVFAQNIDAGGQARGVSGFVVPRDTRGVRMGPEALTLGMRAMVQNTVYLDDARVTHAQRLGEIGGGMRVAQEAMQQGRLAIGAAAVGGIKRCLQLLVRYAERRNVSTGRLLDNPVLLDRAASVRSALAGLEALVATVADRLDRGLDVPIDAFVVCKVAGSEWLWRAADDLVQFLGGRGYIETNVAAQLLRDARVTRILEGPTEALEMFTGSRVVNDGAGLHAFLRDALAAPQVSSRLAAAAAEIHARATATDVDAVDGRRWAYSLIGRLAGDAVLLAATPSTPAALRARAERRFQEGITSALARAAAGQRPSGAEAQEWSREIALSIGDIEQSLAGEDHELDPLLRRAVAGAPAPLVALPPPVPETEPRHVAVSAPAQDAAAPAAVDRREVPVVEIERFVVRHLAKALKMRETAIDPGRSVFDYGVDSVTAVTLAADLEEWLGIVCDPDVVYAVPVIRRFAAHVASRPRPR
jgi:acyl-CoA synthetase (AMP-forming)/AMP-acid ligase II/alkylation response protein AidB-like acyl-CoA dehydrogenase/acyl carrier protein